MVDTNVTENLTEGYIYDLPTNVTSPGEVLFGTPMQYTGGLYINVFLIGFFSILTIGSMQYQYQPSKAVTYSSFATFGLTFLLSLAGFAAGNQLIPAAVLFIASVAFNIAVSNNGGVV